MGLSKIKQQGFTLIELVIVLVILGILAAVIVPRYVDLSSDALAAAQAGMIGSVKSSYAIYIAENKAQPTVAELASSIAGTSAVATGVQVTINNTQYVVLTFTDTACATATTATTDTVSCIEGIGTP